MYATNLRHSDAACKRIVKMELFFVNLENQGTGTCSLHYESSTGTVTSKRSRTRSRHQMY